jgi:two-component system chemotaxis sensor kinase CheA
MMDLGLMEQLQASFLPEAADLLADLGDALLILEQEPHNTDLINRVFRAMHTLKGSGATAGFRRLANFVHHVEEIFNRIRNQQLEISPELIDAALKASDCCAMLLDLGPSSDVPLDLETEVLASIRPYLPDLEELDKKAQSAIETTHKLSRYKVGFHPNREIFFSGTDPASLLLELTDLGEIEVCCDVSDLSESVEFDPEQCYLKWEVSVETSQPESAIRAVFQFVEDDCKVVVEMVQQSDLAGLSSKTLQASGQANLASTPRCSEASQTSEVSVVAAAQSIRVDAVKLDALMRLASELLVTRGALPAFAQRLEAEESMKTMAKEMRDAGAKVSRLANDLQATVMSIRMMPARHIFQRFPRLVRDIGRSLDKEMELQISGEETELDKTVIESIGDPLTHIIRNAADHGIESRAERLQSGKSALGCIKLSAYTRGSNVVIEVRDDGKGLDAEKLKKRAVQKGLLSEAVVAVMDEDAAFKIILMAGFSTNDTVTDLSGRGVGMDVVRNSVEALHGAINIQSKLGEGTCFRIDLPASLLISRGILVDVSEQQVVLPMDTIRNMVKISRSAIRTVRGQQIAHVRGAIMPLLSLATALSLGHTEDAQADIAVAVIDVASGPYGLIVDRFVGEVEIVVKPLGGPLAKVPEYAGAAIMGDGKTVLVVNTEALFSLDNST